MIHWCYEQQQNSQTVCLTRVDFHRSKKSKQQYISNPWSNRCWKDGSLHQSKLQCFVGIPTHIWFLLMAVTFFHVASIQQEVAYYHVNEGKWSYFPTCGWWCMWSSLFSLFYIIKAEWSELSILSFRELPSPSKPFNLLTSQDMNACVSDMQTLCQLLVVSSLLLTAQQLDDPLVPLPSKLHIRRYASV